jgi:glycosidase
MTRASGSMLPIVMFLAACGGCAPVANAAGAVGSLPPLATRLPEDEIIYLLMPDRFENGDAANDRGGMQGGRLVTGFDPTDKAFYHGGDLKGATARLPYIRDLGATAIWLTPVFRNKAVQGRPGEEGAGYHGYWPLDFESIDPHLGIEADYRALVDRAHALGLKVYLDIVINHTADVIQYRECPAAPCAYRPLVEAAYTPFLPAGDEHAKRPAWLNDPRHYHNRGDSTFSGESSQAGDFFGLDDVATEQPRVVQGFIDIYAAWIRRFRLDGMRIDTERHVNPEFWQAFVPAMQAAARKAGVAHFHVFGEVMDASPAQLARHTWADGLPAVNDFALHAALVAAVAEGGPTQAVADVLFVDPIYRGGEGAARRLVTLTGNHDVYRFAHAVRKARPGAPADEVMRRVLLANAMLLASRGIPALYYGDEQGYTGEGNMDQDSREDMFTTQVPSFARALRLGGAHPPFDELHPMYVAIAAMTGARLREPALRRGRQVLRAASPGPGLLAWSRMLPGDGEILAVFNTSDAPLRARVLVGSPSTAWLPLLGECTARLVSPGVAEVELPPLGYMLCKATGVAAGQIKPRG